MQLLALAFCAILLPHPKALAQESISIIDWLASLQALEQRLRTNPNDASAPSDLRSLHRDIVNWSAAHPDRGMTVPPLPAGSEVTPPALIDYTAKLRGVLEEVERNRPSGAFNMGRLEVNVTASAVQVPTATTLDEYDYRFRNLPKMADALNHVPGVSIQRIGPRNERGVYVRGFDFRQVPLYMDGIPIYVPYDG